ncbi:MAG: oligosaccharide flippase family protein [Bacteroidota bacterium]
MKGEGKIPVIPSVLKNIPLRQYPWFLNIQFINLLLPLASYPYLLRVIGPEKYGLVAVSIAVGLAVTTITEYGISFTGVKDVSRMSDDSEKVSYYLSEVLLTRFIMLSGCCAILFIFFFSIPILKSEFLLFGLTVVGIFPNMLFPQWLYVGLQKIRRYNGILFFNRALSVIFIFLLIKEESDYSIYPLVNLISATVTAAVSFRSLRTIGIRLRPVPFNVVWNHMRHGFYPFISQSLTLLYVQINPILLLALIHDTALVGYYSLAEKIVVTSRNLTAPLNQLFLPGISKKFAVSIKQALHDVTQFAAIVGVVNILLVAALDIFAGYIVLIVAGEEYWQAALTVRILSPIILFISLNNLAGVHVLLNLDLKKEFFIGIAAGVVVNLFLLLLLFPYASFNSPAVSWTVSEAVVLGVFILYIKKYRESGIDD